ncbi:hypothetical protein D1007_53173 [Hordeum vulgare]|nr:hypothetical protein D1007_53173 [Hordeum vulgare]
MASTSGFIVDESGKQGKGLPISSTNDHSAISQGMENVDTSGTALEVIDVVAGKHDAFAKLVDTYGCEETGRSTTMDTKRGTHSWKSEYNIADRNESRMPLKAMLASADLHAATLSELSLSTLSSHAELVVAVVPPLPFPSVPLSSFE